MFYEKFSWNHLLRERIKAWIDFTEYFSSEILFPSISRKIWMFYKVVWYIGSCIHINILCTFSICWAKIASCTISKLKYPFSDAWWKTWAPEGKKSRRIHSVAYSMPRGFAWVRASILMCRSGFFNILIFLRKLITFSQINQLEMLDNFTRWSLIKKDTSN